MHRSIDELTLPEFGDVHRLGVPSDIQSTWVTDGDSTSRKAIKEVSVDNGAIGGFKNDLVALQSFRCGGLTSLREVFPKGSDLMLGVTFVDALKDASPFWKACWHSSTGPIFCWFEHVAVEPFRA